MTADTTTWRRPAAERRIRSIGRTKFATALIFTSIVSFLVGGTANATGVAAGNDVWQTPSGNGTHHDFAGMPIPAGFFDPGSDPFAGDVPLEGAGTGCNDTVIRRLVPAAPLPVGAQATISIEILELNLLSTDPINVGNSGEWDMQVTLTPGPQPTGSMTIKHQTLHGGTYDANFGVCARATFTRVLAPFDVLFLDLCPGDEVQIGAIDAPWTHHVELPLICPNASADFLALTPAGEEHTGPHPPEQIEVDLAPALTPFGLAIAVGAMGTFAAWRRRSTRR